MSSNLLKAVEAQLEAAHRVVSHLVADAVETEDREIKGRLVTTLGDLKNALFGEPAVTGDAKPTTNEAALAEVPTLTEPAPQPVELAHISKIMEALSDERYVLRSVASLANKAGVSEQEVYELLDDNDVDYETRKNRTTGADLIGLSHRVYG